MSFLPHPLHDCATFSSLEALVQRIEGQGYYGGVRLLMVMVVGLPTREA